VRRWALLVLLAAACDTRVGADPARVFVLDRLRLDRAQAERAAAHLDNPSFPCTAILATVATFTPEWERIAPATRAELDGARGLCRAASLTYGLTRVARLEAAHRTHTTLVEECFDLERALGVLATSGPADRLLAGLSARKRSLCP
jgi:hypothetical protein